MDDLTGAYAYFLQLLAEKPDARSRALARRVWGRLLSDEVEPHNLRFCEEALVALGIARRGVHPDYGGVEVLFPGDGLPDL